MMSISPFDKPGKFYRGNLHTHSTLSDGKLAPEMVCKVYQDAGYDFIALTDHFMQQFNYPVADTRAFRSENFTTILGAELHAGRTELGELWHILGVGLPLDFAPPAPEETGPELAARALAAGA
jgi:predicted metal-dependent phosphoesterase TrpH